jgi:hypothetical protein
VRIEEPARINELQQMEFTAGKSRQQVEWHGEIS